MPRGPDSSPRDLQDVLKAFTRAARWFYECVAEARGHWEEPGLGEWDVRGLVGHTSRAMSTLERAFDTPADRRDVRCAADYFALAARTDHGAIAQRGREAAAALGDDPVAAIGALVDRVIERLGALGVQSSDELVTTALGGMRLADYLPTRTFELVVHTCDLAAALDLPEQVPEQSATAALTLMAELAVRSGLAGPLLRATTGRVALPQGTSVLSAPSPSGGR